MMVFLPNSDSRIVPAANLQLQIWESNTVGLMSNLQAQISSKPVALPSKNGDSHIFTNYHGGRDEGETSPC